MSKKNYADKIRRRKLRLKQINTELNPASTKKRKSWLWVPVSVALLVAAIFLIFRYKDRLPEEWSNYENLMLPIALISALALLFIMWVLPKLYVKSLRNKSLGGGQSEFDREKEKLKLEDDTRKTLAQIIGGAVFLFGLIFTYNSFVLNREGQITDRFTKAVEQLGDEDIAVRLGGLYALERIAKDSPKDQWTIMEIVSAYVRERSPKTKGAIIAEKTVQKERDELTKTKSDSDQIKIDIQAALTIIGRRIIEQDPPGRHIDLKDAKLSGADLRRADLSGAILLEADLSGANLRGANLNKAYLLEANLSRAYLSGADLSGADLIVAKLIGADLRGAKLIGADLRGANLRGTDLSGTDLSGTDLSGANLSGVDLSGAILLNSQNLLYEQISKAIIDEETKLPEYLESQRNTLLEISKKKLEELFRSF